MAMLGREVFISYSAQDKQIADKVCAALESDLLQCWIAPRDVMPGQPLGAAILDAIAEAKVMVLLFSASANSSPHVIREVDRAINRGVAIVPFRIEDAAMSKEMEFFISSAHWLDATNRPVDLHFSKLINTVRRLLVDAQPVVLALSEPTPVERKPVRPATTPPARSGSRLALKLGGACAIAFVALLAIAAFWMNRLPHRDGPSAPPATMVALAGPVLPATLPVPPPATIPVVARPTPPETSRPKPPEIPPTKSPPKPPTNPAATPPVQQARRIDLLQLVDVAKDQITGKWAYRAGELTASQHRNPLLELPYAPPAEYDLRIAFYSTPGVGHQITSILAENDRQFIWVLGGLENTTCGFAEFDGKAFGNNQTTKKAAEWISDQKPHVSLVKVRRDVVEAYLDGKLVSSLNTDYSGLTLFEGFRLRHLNTIGLCIGQQITVRSIDVIEISGPGKLLR